MQALGIHRRAQLLKLSYPVDELPPRDFVFLISCHELSLPAKTQHRASPIALVRDVLAHLPIVRELEKRNGGQRVGLVLRHNGAGDLWLDDSVPLYAFDLGERMETLELRTRPRDLPLLPLRVLAETSDLAAPPAPWLCVNAGATPASVIPQVLASLRLPPHPQQRLLRHTDDGWHWLTQNVAVRAQVVAGDVLSVRSAPVMELTPVLTPPPAPLLLSLDTSVAEACRRLARFVPGVATSAGTLSLIVWIVAPSLPHRRPPLVAAME